MEIIPNFLLSLKSLAVVHAYDFKLDHNTKK